MYRKSVQKFIDGVPDGLEIVNTGSTFALHGFDYKYFGKKGFNFALAPQPLSYDYKILNQYKGNLVEGAVVVLVVCPFAFFVTDYSYDHNNFKYYYFLDRENILNYSRAKNIIIKSGLALLNPREARRIASQIIKRILRYDTHKNKPKNYIKNTALSSINGWKNEFGLSDTIAIEPSEELNATFEITTGHLKNMIDLCVRCKFRPIIVSMPTCKEESDAFSAEFIEKIYTQNVRKSNIHNAPVFDYFTDNRFHDHSLYITADCLNEKGRKHFAEVFIEDLTNLGLVE